MVTKINVRADFFANGNIKPISFSDSENFFEIESIKTKFKNDYYVFEVICGEKRYTILFDGKCWYMDDNNWRDYMGLRKKSL